MGRLRSILVAVCAVAGLTAGLVPFVVQPAGADPGGFGGPGGPGSPPALPAGDWPTLFNQAFSAVQSYENAGPVTGTSTNSTPVNSWLHTPSGDVAVNQSSELATDNTDTLLIGVSDLGEQQLLVNIIIPGTGDPTTLVLAPASQGSQGGESAQALHGSIQEIVKGKERKAPSAGGAGGLTPDTDGGCYEEPTAPVVVGSVFGPLVQGTGVVDCPLGAESVSLIATLYRWSTSVASGGGSTYGSSLAVNVYSACNPSGNNPYATAELFSVNGSLAGGATSKTEWLGCD